MRRQNLHRAPQNGCKAYSLGWGVRPNVGRCPTLMSSALSGLVGAVGRPPVPLAKARFTDGYSRYTPAVLNPTLKEQYHAKP